ncbi:MAG: hypothetical protein A2504_02955 [Bdellovibrionales bacterium RIFOXYD12_FULL_39_22]|nr:MAG: hypothetical protein A2385_05670 [Bdellovibrionales bacterium RIFOXYB1_FULL_39_21]OFZ42241.1 MAG: hypothetical protein A2485_15700 [Bdellovibrionales bacterium RIFOXYC12_FULL_39_17]OFZ46667.1 MAG: hypothetical protein A2404_03970 [Bdellovibrionales bacterium RIFOXYC1_FULL_39_130]OFZ71756.1 MAG: hypothetical protein A2451_08305 [Bdellovibrionales bacterium RIFOXYC2_FULL_39_8]OFZ76056.1 MAG: hypothetical protein A2560_03180 [Bdellovibrionales bacterium RIFOXYD1_FULL_39_84]OFZ93040.1 MAG:
MQNKNKQKNKDRSIFEIVGKRERDIRQTIVNAEAMKDFGDVFGKKILIVDDDQAFTDFVVHSLKSFGLFEVKSASDAGWGIKKFIDEVPDLLIIDIFLPQTDGLKLAKAMLALYEREFPILFVSANKSFGREIEESGFAAKYKFLAKPINKELLKEYVTELLR